MLAESPEGCQPEIKKHESGHMFAAPHECCQAEIKNMRVESGHMLAASLECCTAKIKNMRVIMCLQNLLSVARPK